MNINPTLKNPTTYSFWKKSGFTWFSQHGHTYECATPPAENQTVNQLNGHLTETSVERHNHRKPLVWINHIYRLDEVIVLGMAQSVTSPNPNILLMSLN